MGKLNDFLKKLKEFSMLKKESTADNYAINYYTNTDNDKKGKNMTAIFDSDGDIYYYVSSAGSHNTFEHAVGYIAGQQNILIEDAKSCEDLAKFGYVIVSAEPGLTSGLTNIYIPEEISEKQQERLTSFEAQAEECNTKHNCRVQINKITAVNKENEDNKEMKL